MTIRLALLSFLVLFVNMGCSVIGGSVVPPKPPVVVSSKTTADITLPDLPERVEIRNPALPENPRSRYVQFPTEIKPNANWRAPADGAWVWRGRDLQAITYGLVEPWRWIDKTVAIVENHNKAYSARKADAERPWWRKLW